MSDRPARSYTEARNAFVKALADYQTATRDMNIALHRVSGVTANFFKSLQSVVTTSGSLLAPRR